MRIGLEGCKAVCWRALPVLLVATLPALAHAAPTSISSEDLRVAYIDPGAGSFIVQALVATAAGVAVATRAYWSRIKAFLGATSSSSGDEESPSRHADER